MPLEYVVEADVTETRIKIAFLSRFISFLLDLVGLLKSMISLSKDSVRNMLVHCYRFKQQPWIVPQRSQFSSLRARNCWTSSRCRSSMRGWCIRRRDSGWCCASRSRCRCTRPCPCWSRCLQGSRREQSLCSSPWRKYVEAIFAKWVLHAEAAPTQTSNPQIVRQAGLFSTHLQHGTLL